METLYVEAVKAVIKLVATRPLDQLKLAWGFHHQLDKLQQEFTYIQAFLHDIQDHNSRLDNTNNLFNAWLQRVLDLAYSADDLMDDYAFHVLHRRSSSWEYSATKGNGSLNRRKLLNLVMMKKKQSLNNNFGHWMTISKSNGIVFHFKMSNKVNHILRGFNELYKDAAKLGLKPAQVMAGGAGRQVHQDSARKSYTYNTLDEVRELAVANTSEFVGRVHVQSQLIKLLSDPNNDHLSTIAIFGMAGLGKTTLARRIYDNEDVVKHFGVRFWIYVFENFTIKRILREMFEILNHSKCELSNIEDIIERIQQLLKQRRYLLVLDDVWNKNQSSWNSLKNSLLRIGGRAGSMILVTTRSKDVVESAEARYVHQLTGLSDEESWAYFKQKAFPQGPPTKDTGFEEIGRRILKRCEGLPLAIGVIGGLLRTKKDIREWEFIEKSKMWSLPQENNDILPSLLFSFNQLFSPSLKQCFAYCAIFPKDALIDREDLINLWNAHGFLQSESRGNSQSPEEVGGKYFDILLNNSLLQAETQCSHASEESTKYRMHDLVHDLALFISKHDWLIWKGSDKMGNTSKGRHLAIFLDDDVAAEEIPMEEMKRLRTLYSHVNFFPWDFLTCTRNLRVLKLGALGLEKVPHSIGCLRHLRYLDLSDNPVDTLPDSITKLYHLQTFRVLGRRLKGLPEKLYRLINLRHIHLMQTRSWCLPQGLESLTALQTLPMLELNGERGLKIGELGALKEIKGLLSISGLEHVKDKEEAQRAGICDKAGISELQLTWGWSRATNHMQVLGAFQPHENLKALVITGYDHPNFPHWMTSMVANGKPCGTIKPLYNLVRVELLYCRMCLLLPSLGHLPRLRDLSMQSMWNVECIGDEFYHFDAQVVETAVTLFPALKMLNISSFESLTEWAPPSSSASAFPLLETLWIGSCDSLLSTPTHFPSLKHLQVDKNFGYIPLYNIVRDSSEKLTSLKISDMPALYQLPDKLLECTSLEELRINSCPNLQSLPRGLGTCSSSGGSALLKKLSICDCSNLESIPDISQLTCLEEVEISRCTKLRFLPNGLEALPCLRSLSIGGFESLALHGDALHSGGPQPFFPALKLLRIFYDDSVEGVPEWIGSISSLEKFELKSCKNLKHLPSQEAMLQLTRLATLAVHACPLLQERCAKNTGPEWGKISHIDSVTIDSVSSATT